MWVGVAGTWGTMSGPTGVGNTGSCFDCLVAVEVEVFDFFGGELDEVVDLALGLDHDWAVGWLGLSFSLQ